MSDLRGKLYVCNSCHGEYYPDQAGGYHHKCPDGTPNPRNENLSDARLGLATLQGAGRQEADPK